VAGLERFLSVLSDARPMTQLQNPSVTRDEIDVLLTEIRLYLEAVDAFRREGREPTWRRDGATGHA